MNTLRLHQRPSPGFSEIAPLNRNSAFLQLGRYVFFSEKEITNPTTSEVATPEMSSNEFKQFSKSWSCELLVSVPWLNSCEKLKAKTQKLCEDACHLREGHWVKPHIFGIDSGFPTMCPTFSGWFNPPSKFSMTSQRPTILLWEWFQLPETSLSENRIRKNPEVYHFPTLIMN